MEIYELLLLGVGVAADAVTIAVMAWTWHGHGMYRPWMSHGCSLLMEHQASEHRCPKWLEPRADRRSHQDTKVRYFGEIYYSLAVPIIASTAQLT